MGGWRGGLRAPQGEVEEAGVDGEARRHHRPGAGRLEGDEQNGRTANLMTAYTTTPVGEPCDHGVARHLSPAPAAEVENQRRPESLDRRTPC